VVLGGAAPAFYGNELADAAPIVIPAGVTLIGDESAPVEPTNRVLEVRGAAAAALVVEAGASVRGVTVRRFAAGAPGVGVLVDGGSPAGGNSLEAVRVDFPTSGFPFAIGLRVAGGNAVVSDVSMSNVHVKGATVAGLEVNRVAAGDVVLVTGSTFDQNQVGVSLLKGHLTMSESTVKRSVAEGVVAATGTPGQTGLALTNDLISWNGRGGVRLSVNESLSITGTRICENVGVDRSLPGATRSVGGIYAVGDPPAALTFQGNIIDHNGGDQMLVGVSGSSWDFTGSSSNLCLASTRNTIANYRTPGVGIAVVGASVVAKFNSWGSAFPIVDRDFAVVSGSVDAGTWLGATDFCGAAPADLTCPLP
jgi:hypothetical protein